MKNELVRKMNEVHLPMDGEHTKPTTHGSYPCLIEKNGETYERKVFFIPRKGWQLRAGMRGGVIKIWKLRILVDATMYTELLQNLKINLQNYALDKKTAE